MRDIVFDGSCRVNDRKGSYPDICIYKLLDKDSAYYNKQVAYCTGCAHYYASKKE